MHNISITVIFLNRGLCLKNKHKHSLFDFYNCDHWLCTLSVSVKSSSDIFLHCIKITVKLLEAKATIATISRGVSGRRIKEVSSSFPMPGDVGEQEAIKQNISIIHFSISCPSSSNRMDIL